MDMDQALEEHANPQKSEMERQIDLEIERSNDSKISPDDEKADE